MFSSTDQNIYYPKSSYLPPQPISGYSIQPRMFHQQVLNPFSFQPSYEHNQLNLHNASKYYEIPRTTDFVDCRQSLPLSFAQSELYKEAEASNGFSKPSNHNSIENTKSKNTSSCAIFIDFSTMKVLPSQEKLTSEELKKPKRINKRWTSEEDQLLYELKKNPNLSWREVASRFPTRTLSACQFRISRLKHIKKEKKIGTSKTYYLNIHSLIDI